MIEKSVYVAFDGEKFEDADECLRYEKKLQMKNAGQWHEINMVFVFSKGLSVHRTSGGEEEYRGLFTSSPLYLYFANDEDAEEFQEITCKLDYPIFYKFDEAGLYRYNYANGWEKVDNLRDKYEEQIKSCEHQIEELNQVEDECEDLIAWDGGEN